MNISECVFTSPTSLVKSMFTIITDSVHRTTFVVFVNEMSSIVLCTLKESYFF